MKELVLKKMMEVGEDIIKVVYVTQNGIVKNLLQKSGSKPEDYFEKKFMKILANEDVEYTFNKRHPKAEVEVQCEMYESDVYASTVGVMKVVILKKEVKEYQDLLGLLKDYERQFSGISLPEKGKIVLP